MQPERLAQDQALRDGAPVCDSSKRNEAVRGVVGGKRLGVLAVWKRFCSSFPRLRRVLLECRTFRSRIQSVLSNTDSYRCPSSFAFLEAPSGCVYENTRSNGRIECIRKLASTNPSTPLDWRLWMESWDQGVEWAVRNLDFDSPSTSEHKALLASELSYKGPQHHTRSALSSTW
jgi:hypothetical protein